MREIYTNFANICLYRDIHATTTTITDFSAAATVEALEEKCDEVRRQVDELNRELEIERRKNERLQHEQRTRKEEAITATIHTNSRQPDVRHHNSTRHHLSFFDLITTIFVLFIAE